MAVPHVWPHRLVTVAAAAVAEAWYYLSADHVVSWLGSSSDPFQPIVIPFNIGAIACIYLIGVALVDRRRSARTRGRPFGLGQLLRRLPGPAALHHHLELAGLAPPRRVLPWPLVSVLTVVIVFVACIGLTELLARTPVVQATDRALAGAVARGRQSERRARDLGADGRERPDRAGRGAQSDLRAGQGGSQRGGDHPVARVVGVQVGPMGGAAHIQVSAQTRATSVGTVPSPGR